MKNIERIYKEIKDLRLEFENQHNGNGIELSISDYDSKINTEERYKSLLSMFPEYRQGYGLDTYAKGYTDQAMTYGLVLSAESNRFLFTKDSSDLLRVREAVRWLIDHSTNGSPAPGWGISVAWDAFADSSENPANQSYTITCAIAIEGLLDALKIPDVFAPDERREILVTIKKVFDYYLSSAWTDISIDSGYFWYSANESDKYFTPNASSAFLGVLSRYYNEHNHEIDNPKFYLSRINAAAKGLVDCVRLSEGLPLWHYIVAQEEGANVRENDLVHHAYILWGLESYRDNDGTIELPWKREDAIRSLDVFWKDDTVYFSPQYSMEVVDETGSLKSRPANLWGIGMMLGLHAKWSEAERAEATIRYLDQNHGLWPRLTLFPLSFSRDRNFYSRHGAHVLWGLANYYFQK